MPRWTDVDEQCRGTGEKRKAHHMKEKNRKKGKEKGKEYT